MRSWHHPLPEDHHLLLGGHSYCPTEIPVEYGEGRDCYLKFGRRRNWDTKMLGDLANVIQ